MNFDFIFPDNRESGETVLRQTQLVMLRMLKILHYLCEKHNVAYFLIGGSSIGAVRHKGFIPWDDDLDIGMTRDNFKSFENKVVPELPKEIFYQSPQTDANYPKCDFVDARLRDKYSSYTHTDNVKTNWHEGLQIDIFVYDNAFAPSKFLIILQNYLVNALAQNNAHRGNILEKISSSLPFKFVYANNWLQELGMLKLGVGSNHIKQEEIKELIKVPFEDTETYIPAAFDLILKRQFGDYMQPPPEEKRVSHHKVITDPFTPCNHSEILYWVERNID